MAVSVKRPASRAHRRQSPRRHRVGSEVLGLGWRLILASGATLLLPDGAPVVMAAETGTLRGNVVDAQTGEALEGVTLNVTGDNLPGARSKVTDARGAFWFPVLPPGTYRVTFVKEGYQAVDVPATVVLDQTTSLADIRLPPLEYEMDVIEIIETMPVLDTTSSAVSTNVDTEYFDRLPVGRTFTGTIRTLPGISGRIDYTDGGPSGGEPSVRGEGQEGNNYLLEGFSIRDPSDKGFAISIPNEAIQEMTVYTDGAPAEYGTFTGMVANILLKSGENQTHGSLEYLLTRTATLDPTYALYNPGLGAVEEVEKRRFSINNAIATLGGAVVEDKLWYFTSLTLNRGWSSPDGGAVRQEQPYSYLVAGRLTYNPFEAGTTLLNFTVLAQQVERSNFLTDITIAPDAQLNGINGALNINANLKTLLSDLAIFEAKYNQWRTEFHSVPVTGDYMTPSYTNIDTQVTYNNAPAAFHEERGRQGLALHLTRYIVDRGGDHVVKGGYEWFVGNNSSEIVYTGGLGTEDAPAYEYQVQGPTNEPYAQTAHYNVGPLSHNSAVNVFFLQDQWQPFSELSLNIGGRLDHERLTQVDGKDLVDVWSFSPRFGGAWDLTGDQKNLLTFNAGRYHDISSLSLAAWGDTRSANYFQVCPYDPESGEYLEGDACVTQDPVLEPSVFDPDFRPYGINKATLGYDRALPGQMSVGIKGIWSRTFNLSEDVNLDDVSWIIRNPDTLKSRQYKALELTARRRWKDNWQFLGSYTFSSSKGTNPGQLEGGSAGNDVGVYLDNPADPFIRDYYAYLGPMFGINIYDGLGYDSYAAYGHTYTGNDEGFYGYLPYHSFHQVKLNGSWEAPWGTQLGAIFEFDSGHAYERRGFLLLYGNTTFPEGRGVRLMPPVAYLDLSLGHTFDLGEQSQVTLQLDVFNVLNSEKPLSYFTNFNQAADYCAGLDSPQSYPICPQYGLSEEESASYVANPGFGQPYFRQNPRSIQAGARFSF